MEKRTVSSDTGANWTALVKSGYSITLNSLPHPFMVSSLQEHSPRQDKPSSWAETVRWASDVVLTCSCPSLILMFQFCRSLLHGCTWFHSSTCYMVSDPTEAEVQTISGVILDFRGSVNAFRFWKINCKLVIIWLAHSWGKAGKKKHSEENGAVLNHYVLE